MKLLVQGEAILARDVVEQGDEIHSPDQIIPKHVVEGWQIVDVDVPEGFTPAGYTWDGEGVVQKPAPIVSHFERDKARYQKRASARDELIAYMAADNMSRVRSGVWTVPQLVSLMDDPHVAAATTYMSTLSYELAAQAIASAATPLLTAEIRADWISKLQAHFYLEG